jgi:hypothetical protein
MRPHETYKVLLQSENGYPGVWETDHESLEEALQWCNDLKDHRAIYIVHQYGSGSITKIWPVELVTTTEAKLMLR